MARITGKEGAVYLGGPSDTSPLKVADIYDWTFEFTQAYEVCPVKGEVHDTVALAGVSSRLTCGRYVQTGANPTRLADLLSTNVPQLTNNYKGLPVEYLLQQIDGGANGATITGTGIITRGSLAAPRGMAVDSLEIMGTTMPTVT